MRVSISDVTIGKKSLTFNFSNHLRGEPVNAESVSGDAVIDLDGNIISKSRNLPQSLKITIIGGIDSHVHRKDPGSGPNFYLTEGQKRTLVSLVQNYGKVMKFDGSISDGENEELNNVVNVLFMNGRG